MKQLIRLSPSFVFAFSVLALVTGPLLAQTADGYTPAEEEVCDIYSGAAFGLCNAYCEAMDCELLDDFDPETSPNASEQACLKVKDNFLKISGESALPCDCIPGEGQFGCVCETDQDCGGDLVCNGSNFCDEPDDPNES